MSWCIVGSGLRAARVGNRVGASEEAASGTTEGKSVVGRADGCRGGRVDGGHRAGSQSG